MPRKEPLNEKIIAALQSRHNRAALLNLQQQHCYARALSAVRGVNRNITNPATQLKK